MPNCNMLKELEKLMEKQENEQRTEGHIAYLVAGIVTKGPGAPYIESVSIKSSPGHSICSYPDKLFVGLGPTVTASSSFQEAEKQLRAQLKSHARWDWIWPLLDYHASVLERRYTGVTIFADEELEEVLTRLGVALGPYDYNELGFTDCAFNESTLECLRQLQNVYCDL